MRNKLTLFKENQILTKSELLYSLSKFKEHYLNSDNEESYSNEKRTVLIKNLEEFIKKVEKREFPDLDNWWFYNYLINSFDITLELCYCNDVEYDNDGYIESMTSGCEHILLSQAFKVMTVNEFAELHNVKPLTVRQWIRRGKLRSIKKVGRDWLISEFSNVPKRKYEPVSYFWKTGNIHSEVFPFINNYNCLYICQNDNDKSIFDVILGCPGDKKREKIEISRKEREKLEVFLLSDNNVTADELSANIQYCPPKKSDNYQEIDDYINKHKYNFDEEDSDELNYGIILVTDGTQKGRIGFYDDIDYDCNYDCEGDECYCDNCNSYNKNAIVYFGYLPITDEYYIIPYKNITGCVSTFSLSSRMNQILHEINDYKYNTQYQKELLNEYILCSDLLNERHMNSMNTILKDEKIQIFISHSKKDLCFARTLSTDLINAGYKVFLDDWSIDIGDRIHDKINENLESCEALIMIISDDYIQSTYCSDEWSAFYKKAASDKKRMLYPIIMDDSEPPLLISTLKYARVKTEENYNEFLNKLLKALKKHYEK